LDLGYFCFLFCYFWLYYESKYSGAFGIDYLLLIIKKIFKGTKKVVEFGFMFGGEAAEKVPDTFNFPLTPLIFRMFEKQTDYRTSRPSF